MTPSGATRGGWSSVWPAVILLAVVGVLAIGPAATVVVGVGRAWGSLRPGVWLPSWSLLLTTLAWAAGIGVCAAAIALPAAWVLRARGWAGGAWVLAPLFMPSYLCYTAYGLVRAPGTWLGDLIERTAQEGWTGLPVLVGRVLALVGLALWAWPVASVMIGVGISRIDQGLLDALRLDSRGGLRHALALFRLSWVWVASGAGVVALLMLGSAVPLHLANAPTYSVRAWMELVLTPGGASTWVSAWPIVLVAAAAATGVVRLGSAAGLADRRVAAAPGRTTRFAAWVVWACSTLVPLLLCLGSLRDWSSLITFWRVSGEGALRSGAVAAMVGVLVVGITLLTWYGASFGPRLELVTRWSAGALLVMGMMPGVLVGKAIAETAMLLPAGLEDSPGVLVWAHVTRFAWIGAVLGVTLARSESEPFRAVRMLEGGGFLGWVIGCLPRGWAAAVGAGIAGAALSLHEIESAIIVQPPGVPSLAQTLLGDLHFARSEELASGVVQVVGAVWVLLVAWALVTRGARRGIAA